MRFAGLRRLRLLTATAAIAHSGQPSPPEIPPPISPRMRRRNHGPRRPTNGTEPEPTTPPETTSLRSPAPTGWNAGRQWRSPSDTARPTQPALGIDSGAASSSGHRAKARQIPAQAIPVMTSDTTISGKVRASRGRAGRLRRLQAGPPKSRPTFQAGAVQAHGPEHGKSRRRGVVMRKKRRQDGVADRVKEDHRQRRGAVGRPSRTRIPRASTAAMKSRRSAYRTRKKTGPAATGGDDDADQQPNAVDPAPLMLGLNSVSGVASILAFHRFGALGRFINGLVFLLGLLDPRGRDDMLVIGNVEQAHAGAVAADDTGCRRRSSGSIWPGRRAPVLAPPSRKAAARRCASSSTRGDA